MGSSESTGRLSGTEKEEEERRPDNDSSGGSSSGTGTAIAIAATGAAMAAWGICRMLSGSTDMETQEKDEAMTIKAPEKETYWLNSRTNGDLEYESRQKNTRSPRPRGRYKMNTDGLNSRTNGDLEYESRQKSTRSLRPRGRYKMNTDGSTHSNQNNLSDGGVRRGPSGYGGILRDDRGKWVRGFRGYIGVNDCLTAEIHGIHKGLKLLDRLGHKKSILESDSEAAVKWMERRDDKPGKSKIINDCWEIIKESWRLIDKNKIEIKFVGRDANKCADKLANMAIESRKNYVEIKGLPNEIKDFFYGQYAVI